MTNLHLPPALRGLFFSFRWDKKMLWALPTASCLVEMSELAWHLALPVWSTLPPEPRFALCPAEVIDKPQQYAYHTQASPRIFGADPL